MSCFQKLFQPVKIGNMELGNRIVMPAMAVGLGADDMVTTSSRSSTPNEHGVVWGSSLSAWLPPYHPDLSSQVA
ncbi:MAG TPA: hypothetical protein EYP71_07705 [Dehalococcoidia bacterium]|nr:hypothetical protein [Dehalococcoidia bacterium]